MMRILLFLILILVVGCSPPPGIEVEVRWASAPVPPAEVEAMAKSLNVDMAMAAAADDTTSPPLMTVLGWMVYYGYDALPNREHRDTWSWPFPTTGSPVKEWEARITYRWPMVDSNVLPMWVTEWLRPGCLVEVRGWDALERAGPWSEPGSYSDPLNTTLKWDDPWSIP